MPSKDNEKPEIDGDSGHGAFSSCTCTRCMTDARKELQTSFSQETWTSNYINKLQAQVERLELENKHLSKNQRCYSSSSCSDISADDQRSILDFQPHDELVAETSEVVVPSKVGFGPRTEIKRRRKLHQKYGRTKIERDDEPEIGNFEGQSHGSESVLTVTREFDKSKHFWRKLVDIVSSPFIEMLHKESPYDINIHVTEEGIASLHEPLMDLFHNRKIMNRFIEKGGYASDSEETKQARAHTKLILEFMRNELDESRILDDIESAQPSGSIDFPNIWLLYSPGTIVYTKESGEYEAFVVDSVGGVQKSRRQRSGIHTYTRLELTCWSINYDGEAFGRVWTQHDIYPFKGTKEISTLDLVPEKFLPDAGNVKLYLQARGEQFWALQGQNYREFTGQVWSGHNGEDSTRVMVDRLTHQRHHNWPISINNKSGPATAVSKNWRNNRSTFYRGHLPPPPPPPPMYDDFVHDSRGRPRPRAPRRRGSADDVIIRDGNPDSDCEQDQTFGGLYTRSNCDRSSPKASSKMKYYDLLQPDEQPDSLTLLLCPQQVHGYCFRDKVWKALNVTQLRPVKFRKNAWDRLVLDDEYKEIVQAMVASYVGNSAKLDDLVVGKGAGLVALLHGPPGSGKTLTAECVAESFEKPLYQITCGDIGTDAFSLESRLSEIFELATTWGCIVLLDEADVFLQERDYVNLMRNALVSGKSKSGLLPLLHNRANSNIVFLRTLEYFNGILFLTTNRIGTFDQAFQSRVHVTLGLPALDGDRRAEVWDIFFEDLARKALVSSEQRSALQSLVRKKWSQEPLNGRQIRNAVRTALLVAERKQEMLGQQHFETVLKIGRDFEQYMSALHHADPEIVAERKGDRLAGYEGFQEVERP